ncbi:uncharacterized protein LOC110909253 [Helianthus annuus]|uniref:uncharacterized protein LOC110909253 n=1 Tax=Helianthus annuus TaxID=4232 RepID=UPI000B8F5DFB|nr:uncharacterized protein LOC110909253 [Helianthus annuus]
MLSTYADDVVFVGDWSLNILLGLQRILKCFHLISGLKVNFHKSRLFGIGVEDREVAGMANVLNRDKGNLPCVHLGLSIGENLNLCKAWKPIIDKFSAKLSSWKANLLSFGGRLTLVNAVLTSIPLYYLSIFKAPITVINKLDRIRHSFLWGGTDNTRKLNWVAWDVVTTPKSLGV